MGKANCYNTETARQELYAEYCTLTDAEQKEVNRLVHHLLSSPGFSTPFHKVFRKLNGLGCIEWAEQFMNEWEASHDER